MTASLPEPDNSNINVIESEPEGTTYGPDMFYADLDQQPPGTSLNEPLPRAWSSSGVIESVKRAVVQGMRETFQLNNTDNSAGQVEIDIEYPNSPESLPHIWVQFSISSLQNAGLNMGEMTKDAQNNWGEIRTFMFEGKITLTCAAETSKDRDRLADAVISQLSFARAPDLVIRKPGQDAQQFRGLIASLNANPYVAITLNTDIIHSGGQQVTNNIPWEKNMLLYEDNYTVTCQGQYNMRFAYDGLYELAEIRVVPELMAENVAYNPVQWRGLPPRR